MRKVLLVIVGVLALAGCGASPGTPSGVVEQVYSDLVNGRLEEAMELFVAEKRAQPAKGMAYLGEFRDFLNAGSFATMEIVGEKVDGNVARLQVRETYENGREMDGNAKLIKEDGDWKLDDLIIRGGDMGVGEHRL